MAGALVITTFHPTYIRGVLYIRNILGIYRSLYIMFLKIMLIGGCIITF